MRRQAICLMAFMLLIALSHRAHAEKPMDTKGRQFKTVGIYIQPPKEAHYYDFFKASGYNYLEFVEGGFGTQPELLPKYYEDMAASIDEAQKKGFKVWILLLAAMKQWKGTEKAGNAGTFSALNKPLLQERLGYIEQAVKGLHKADGFVFFAGDPGGDPEGKSTVDDCLDFSTQVHEIVRKNAPKAGFTVNLWAIAEWAGFPSPFSLDFWQKQVKLSKAVAASPLLGADCGVVFSLDNYYRSLTLMCYDGAGVKPELYPTQDVVTKLHERGVKNVFGWPYFLVDEVDDGFITPNNVDTKGQSQAETRYIRSIVEHGRSLGLDGLVSNASYIAPEALNIYAFGRMCKDASITPEALLDEYAGFLATKETKKELGLVLRFIENKSNWQNSLPKSAHLADFDCGGITTAEQAEAALAKVVPLEKSPIVLPETPTVYLGRLQKRLEEIARGNIGGYAKLPVSKPAR